MTKIRKTAATARSADRISSLSSCSNVDTPAKQANNTMTLISTSKRCRSNHPN